MQIPQLLTNSSQKLNTISSQGFLQGPNIYHQITLQISIHHIIYHLATLLLNLTIWIHELARNINMMIVQISPIFIIYHLSLHCLFMYPTFHWCLVFWKKTSASKSTCQCFVLSSVQKHSQICLHSNVQKICLKCVVYLCMLRSFQMMLQVQESHIMY